MATWLDTAAPFIGVIVGAQLTRANERSRERRRGRIAAMRLIARIDASPNILKMSDDQIVNVRVGFAEAEISYKVWDSAENAIWVCRSFFELPENRDDPWHTVGWGNVPLIRIGNLLPEMLRVEVMHPWAARLGRRKRLKALVSATAELEGIVNERERELRTAPGVALEAIENGVSPA